MRLLKEPHPVVLRLPFVDRVVCSPVGFPGRAKVSVGIDSLDGFFAASLPSDCGEDQDSGVGGARGSRLVLKTSARTDLDLVACGVFLRWFPVLFLGSLLLGSFLLSVCTLSVAADCRRASRSCGSSPSAAVVAPDVVSAFANVPQPPALVFENAPGNPPVLGGPSLFAELLRHAVRDNDRAWQEKTALRSVASSRSALKGLDEVEEVDRNRACCDPALTASFCRQNVHTNGLLRSWIV